MQPNQLPQPLTADEVVKDITWELSSAEPSVAPIVQAIAEAKKRQQDFRESPILGGLLLLKQLVFGLNRSTFMQQFELNDLILELFDDLYYELRRQETNINQRLGRLEHILKDKPAEQPLPPGDNALFINSDMPVLKGFQRLYSVSAELLMPERLLLYSLIYGLKPATCLEIGTFHGGSALIICAALDDLDAGRLICLDPKPKIATTDWETIAHRAKLLRGPSPGALSQAAEMAGQPFDFAFIDGDHSYDGVLQDIEGVLPLLAPQSYLLFHDCHYPEVAQAIDEAVRRHEDQLLDCGILSVDCTQLRDEDKVEAVPWGGLRLVRFTSKSPR